MSYKKKFDASKDDAHNQNIATKILKDLGKLRATVDQETSNSRRWIWELVQNAKDVAREGGVTIKISKKKDGDFWFSHDGKPFKADNIRYLVEQISTKDQDEEDEEGKRKTTGKFGTGFLTTHLLCERVTVHGILKEDDEPYKKFEVELDRTGYSNKEIIESVKESRKILDLVDDLPDLDDHDPEEMNTKFQYPISDEVGIKIMIDGIADLRANIGYSLSVSDEIKVVSIGSKKNKIYKTDEVISLGDVGEIVKVVTEKGDEQLKYSHYAVLKKNFTSIIAPVEVNGDEYSILERDENVPSLFCEFPLIGSESFSFPVVINNPNFNPTEPRDGVTLTTPSRPNPDSVENKIFITEAIELYEVFAKYATDHQWGNLHLLARINDKTPQIEWLNRYYFENTVVNGVRNVIRKKNIVTTSDGSLIPLFSETNAAYALIPRINKLSLRDKFWEKGITIFGTLLPKKEHMSFWSKYAWDNCGKFDSLVMCKYIETSAELEVLEKAVKTDDIYEWLNSFYLLLEEDVASYDRLIAKYKIFPDQNGEFEKKSALTPQEGDINETFKLILAELGDDVKGELLDTEITFDLKKETPIDEDAIVRRINGLVPEKAKDRETAKRYRTAFNLLLTYFREEEKDAKTRFKSLYINKYMLFDEEMMIANTVLVEELDSLLEEFDFDSISDIKKALAERSSLENNSRELLPITSEIISSLGITNLEDWKEAMKDKNLATMFDHTSLTSRDMFIAAATYIEKANKNIIKHLDDLVNYDTDEHFFTANTTLSGVRKDGKPIEIVCRPAYKNEVIIYYETEKAVLDYGEGELWIDSSNGVEKITLGRILKKAKIKKFPV